MINKLAIFSSVLNKDSIIYKLSQIPEEDLKQYSAFEICQRNGNITADIQFDSYNMHSLWTLQQVLKIYNLPKKLHNLVNEWFQEKTWKEFAINLDEYKNVLKIYKSKGNEMHHFGIGHDYCLDTLELTRNKFYKPTLYGYEIIIKDKEDNVLGKALLGRYNKPCKSLEPFEKIIQENDITVQRYIRDDSQEYLIL